MKTKIPAFLILASGCALVTLFAHGCRTSNQASRQTPQASGGILFEIHCSACHGETGGGDGPGAIGYCIPPPDLRTITIRRGGLFPEQELCDIIDGRKYIAAHGMRQMPFWGTPSLDSSNQPAAHRESLGREAIAELVTYIRTMQR